jgi:hypothetical protein
MAISHSITFYEKKYDSLYFIFIYSYVFLKYSSVEYSYWQHYELPSLPNKSLHGNRTEEDHDVKLLLKLLLLDLQITVHLLCLHLLTEVKIWNMEPQISSES